MKTKEEVEQMVRQEQEGIMSLKPLRNLDVMLMLICVACGTKVYVRALDPVRAREMALAGGWGFVSMKPPMALCPFENPADRVGGQGDRGLKMNKETR